MVLAISLPLQLLTQAYARVDGGTILYAYKAFSIALGAALIFATWTVNRDAPERRQLERVDYIVLAALSIPGGFITALFSVGIGELVASFRMVGRLGGSLKILKPSKKIQDSLSLTRLLPIFEVFEDDLLRKQITLAYNLCKAELTKLFDNDKLAEIWFLNILLLFVQVATYIRRNTTSFYLVALFLL